MLSGLNRRAAALAAVLQSMYLASIRPKLAEERGDTNFISILIILAIVILLATAFMGFKDQILAQVEAIVSKFKIQ